MIVALAGRRIDEDGSRQPRFPLNNVGRVSKDLCRLLVEHGATSIVSSAACGADLIGLTEARKLGLRRRVILPFGRTKFRKTSVIDRPGGWGSLYDEVLDEVEAAGDLVTVDASGAHEAYTRTSKTILDEAVRLGKDRDEPVAAVVIWDGEVRDKPDYTSEFRTDAHRRGLVVFEIRTV
jgi:hypothetical protein